MQFFHFDPNQGYQLDAISSVVDAFEGLGTDSAGFESGEHGQFYAVANRLDIAPDALLKNVRAVQTRNTIPVDEVLELVSQTVETPLGSTEFTFPNLSVEMETGTGKTYVYLRTALELHRRYGLRKFVVVVPSIAIREGVLATFQDTREHFRDLFDNVPYHYCVYDSGAPGLIREFSSSESVAFLIMTLDSFNRDSNLIHRPSDLLQGDQPISLLRTTRPILILDEPQNMESDIAFKALASLCPSVALRYSATHRNPYNLVYRLTPLGAYREGLVKQVEVAGVERESDANQPFVHLTAIRETRRTSSAAMRVQVLRSGGGVREKRITVRSGTSLEEATGRPEYNGYVVDEINAGTRIVRFTNNVEIEEGSTFGADRRSIFDNQIQYTVREHFLKQARLRGRNIKVLSLFFIDSVANYAGDEPIIRQLFDNAFEKTKANFDEWRSMSPADVQAAYFAKKARKGGQTELIDSSGTTDDDKRAFELIMRDKKRLMSFEEPVAFIFSHSALREGWDNPNIFQICTLNQSVSETRKRQEIGRGIRLAVNQSGERVHDPAVNVLTVVANESYERYVERYQSELDEDYGDESAGTRVRNARRRSPVRLRKDVLKSPAFVELWAAISPKTHYSVKVDTDALLESVVPALAREPIRPVRVTVAKGRIVATAQGFDTQTVAGSRTLSTSDASGSADGVVETMVNLLERSSPPLFITRRTLHEVFEREERKESVLANPHEWASTAVRLLREHLADQLVDGVRYEKTGEVFDSALFDAVTESWIDRLVPATRAIYDHVTFDSDVERRFVERLEADERTRVYSKLPAWFKIATPVGAYNPDWAIVREDRDEHGTARGLMIVVAETKGLLQLSELRPDERRKILCGKAHFAALGVRFEVVTALSDLDQLDHG